LHKGAQKIMTNFFSKNISKPSNGRSFHSFALRRFCKCSEEFCINFCIAKALFLIQCINIFLQFSARNFGPNLLKMITLMGLLFFSLGVVHAQNASEYVTKIREKEDLYLEEDALVIAKQAVARYPSSKELLCKCSILCSKVGQRQTDKTQRKAYFSLAQFTAKAALKLNPNDAICNLVMSIAMGRMALVSNLNDKIKYSRDIHKYSIKATQLDANLAPAWHVVGKYNLVISELSAFEKKSVQVLMGGLPAGDLPTALICFEKCYNLDKTYITHMIDLARAYIKANRIKEAKRVLTEIGAAPRKTFDDAMFKQEAVKMLLALK
jgi:tetratricopeptide (TPR) repeat protein